MGLYSAWLIIGRAFPSEIWGEGGIFGRAYLCIFVGGGGGGGGLLSEFYDMSILFDCSIAESVDRQTQES